MHANCMLTNNTELIECTEYNVLSARVFTISAAGEETQARAEQLLDTCTILQSQNRMLNDEVRRSVRQSEAADRDLVVLRGYAPLAEQ